MERIAKDSRLNLEWMGRVSRKLIAGLLVCLGIALIGMIVNSSRLAVARGERDQLNQMNLAIVKNQLDDMASFLGKLGSGPSKPGDSQLGDLAVVKQEALLLKHSGLYAVYDNAPGPAKIDFSFSEAPEQLQLVIYNLDRLMTTYHYQLNDQEQKDARDLAAAVHDLAATVKGIDNAAFNTDKDSLAKLKAYQEKADKVTRQAQKLIAELKKD